MSEEELNMPLLGDKFPNLTVPTTHGELNLLEEFKEKWFVLFSHPGDFTPVCTTEFVAFSRKQEEFKALNCELIGLSIDQVFSHIKWIDWIEENLREKINFPIIADEQGKIAKSLGMIHSNKGTNTVRAVFIVDNEGVLRTILYYPQEVGRNIDEIKRTVEALQTSDEKKVALPADWPENELIQDKGILPPASNVDVANQRKNKEGCYDWWFCYKDL